MPALSIGLRLERNLTLLFSLNSPLANPLSIRRLSISHSGTRRKFSTLSMMDSSESVTVKDTKCNPDKHFDEEYAGQAKLLQEFCNISNVDKAWIFNSCNGNGSWAMFCLSQINLLANKRNKYILSSYISKEEGHSVNFQWTPFPIELVDVSTVVPSPSGSKLLVVRNGQNGSAVRLEIWSTSHMQREIHIPVSVHGPLYTDEWFEGISWSHDEELIAYVAEAPSLPKPVFNHLGFKKGTSDERDISSWKGQGDWEEHWGESYSGKGKPSLFVVNIISGEAHAVEGIPESLSVGQVLWAPLTSDGAQRTLVFVGWSANNGPHQVTRKLGIKYCYNRPCSLYAVRSPLLGPKAVEPSSKDGDLKYTTSAINLTEDTQSAFFPCFTPDGRFLLFLSAKSAVESGAHCTTNSLHRMDWSSTGRLGAANIVDLVPVVMHADVGSFPGLYCGSIIGKPWLSDGSTLILSSVWGSTEVLISVDVLSGKLLRISPHDSDSSWNLLAVDGGNVLAVSSNPVSSPQIKYGCFLDPKENKITSFEWDWQDVSLPQLTYSEKVKSMLSLLQFSILKIGVNDLSEKSTAGAKQPFEAIFISSNSQIQDSRITAEKESGLDPLIVCLHGGPHSVSLASYSKSLAFLASLGYSLLLVNYRGSLGFGEEALQSLLGKVGSQDVKDVLTAIDHVVNMGRADPCKIFVLGGSHGGFLTTHLIGQEPDKFVAAAVRNPVCNIALMVGTSDIPDWCYVETCGSEGKIFFTEAPSLEHLGLFYRKSPISHLSKVKAPVLFLLGAQDLRVPVSNGLQYARALKEKGVEVKVIMFPNDIHAIDRPQSDFEGFVNIGVWFRKHCK